MIRKDKERTQTILLRKKGYSINEIAKKIHVSKSSIFLWVSKIKLSHLAKGRIHRRSVLGKERGLQAMSELRMKIENDIEKSSKLVFDNLHITENETKLLCSFLWACEGEKQVSSGVRFINSDPVVIKTFLTLLRRSYVLDEKKFRVVLHLHSYHNKELMVKKWSQITNIPAFQFNKPYQKKNSGRNKNFEYIGCASVRYHDHIIAKELKNIFEKFSHNMGS